MTPKEISATTACVGLGLGAALLVFSLVPNPDDLAIATAVTCTVERASVTDYETELTSRIYGEHLYRQLLADLRTRYPNLPAETGRQMLLLSTCKGANPTPFPLVSK